MSILQSKPDFSARMQVLWPKFSFLWRCRFYDEISKIAKKIAIFWNHTGIVNHHRYTFPPFFWYRIPETFKISCTSWFQGRVIGFVAQNCSNEKFRIFHPRRYSAWKLKKSKKLKTWKSQNPWFVMVIFFAKSSF